MQVIDDTQQDLVRLMAIDFGTGRRSDFHNDLIEWLHYRARRVPMLPRHVHISSEILLQREAQPAIEQIRTELAAGKDVGPWLSERTRTRKADHRADMMFNDWQIVHFHLGRFFQSPTTVRRSGLLLYAHVSAEEATLLDVQPHGAWAQQALLEILLRTNPPALERYEARGVTPTRLTDEQYGNLRANGGNITIEIGGRAFMPGIGLMASGHAARLVAYRDWFLSMTDKLRRAFEAGCVDPRLKPAMYTRLGVPVRLGAYYDHYGLAIIDKNRNGLMLHQMKPLE